MPGPKDSGANHDDGANMFARALEGGGGKVLWRAFVYETDIDYDRAKCAYKEFTPLGSKDALRSNARIIAATNVALDEQVARRAFREDLYYRLSVFPITVPPLRDRRDDIPDLADHFHTKVITGHPLIFKDLIGGATLIRTAVSVVFVQVEIAFQDDHKVKRVVSSLPAHPELIPDIVIGQNSVFVEHPVKSTVATKVQVRCPHGIGLQAAEPGDINIIALGRHLAHGPEGGQRKSQKCCYYRKYNQFSHQLFLLNDFKFRFSITQ